MSWFRVDDKWADSAKVDVISDVAARLWAICGTWCSKKENRRLDGFVPKAALGTITKRRWTDEVLELAIFDLVETSKVGGLYECGLWEPVDGGWVFHDWEDYKPRESDEPSLSPTEVASVAGKASAAARKRRTGTAQPPNSSRTDAEQKKQFGEQFDRTDTSNIARTPEPPDPDPVPDQNNLKPMSKDLTGFARNLPAAHTEQPAPSVVNEIPSQSNALPPVAAPTTSAATSQPPPVSTTRQRPILDDPFRRSLEPQTELVEQLFEAWRDEAGKPGATLDGRGLQFWRRLAHEGVTVEQVRDAMRGAKLDDWARDTAQLAPSPILGSAEQRLKFIGIGKSPPRTTSKTRQRPPQPNDENNRYVPPRIIR